MGSRPKSTVRQGDGTGATAGFRGGKGKPGYPVPDKLKNVVEDVLAKLMSSPDVVEQGEDKEVVGKAASLDLVVLQALKDIFSEKKKSSVGLAHLDELPLVSFVEFVQRFSEGAYEISEKVDGSANMTFGVREGHVWTKSKNGLVYESSGGYPKKAMYRSLQMAHRALESRLVEVLSSWPSGVTSMSADVLYTRIPNSIEYGPNVIVVHGVNSSSPLTTEEESKLVSEFAEALNEGMTDGAEGWRLEYKRVLTSEQVKVSLAEEKRKIKETIRNISESSDRLKVQENLRALQLEIKEKLVRHFESLGSAYGSQVEGFVFTDRSTGNSFKLVDKDRFTALNRFLWNYREQLDKGVKLGEQWKPGIMQQLRNGISDNVLQHPVAKTPMLVKRITKFSESINYPSYVKTSENRADYALAKYIDENRMLGGDFISGFMSEISKVKENFRKLQNEWVSQRKNELTCEIKGKTYKMDNLIKRRTDEAFNEVSYYISSAERSLRQIREMNGDLTRKVAAMKVFLGPRYDKLVSEMKGDLNEDLDSEIEKSIFDTVEFNSGKLEKKGYKIIEDIGMGKDGIAFSISGNRVLKVTSDDDEAKSCSILKGKTVKGVVKIFDVFRFHVPEGVEEGYGIFGIVQEHLQPLGFDEVRELAEMIRVFDKISTLDWYHNTAEQNKQKALETLHANPDMKDEILRAIKSSEKFKVEEIIQNLKNQDIDFLDFHEGNMMKRGNEYVIIDLGTSDSSGKKPNFLESIVYLGEDESIDEVVVGSLMTLIKEAKADKVGVTIGRFQPFHKGHGELIRDLAKKFNKVIILVAGNGKDGKNPFSFETRKEMMEKSLPDVLSKTEIYKAEFGGKNSGYIPGIISDIIKNERSSVEIDTGIHVLVGLDRFNDIKKQFDHALKWKDQGGDLMFDPSLAVVQKLDDVKNDDDVERVSGTKVREAIINDRKDDLKKLLDQHLVSNPSDFEDIYVKLRKEIEGQGAVRKQEGIVLEDDDRTKIDDGEASLRDLGGTKGAQELLSANQEKLMKSKWKIDITKLTPLGTGAKGVAFDMGNGKVLKITTDPQEAITSFSINGKSNLQNIVHIYDVFRFAVTPDIKVPVYGLVSEKLIPLSTAEQKEFDSTLGEIKTQMGKDLYYDLIMAADWNKFIEGMKQGITEAAKEESGGNVNPRVLKAVDARMKRYIAFLNRFNFQGIMRDLKAANIKFYDYHGGNMMKRGSTYIINDLGKSEVPGSKEPPQLENVVVEMIISELVSSDGIGGSILNVKGGSSGFSSARFHSPSSGSQKDILGKTTLEGIQKWSADNPYDFEPYKGVGLGIGRGEHKVAWELSRDLKKEIFFGGGTETYDLLFEDGKKYEVKEPDSSLSIRPGAAGISSSAEVTGKLKQVIFALNEAFSHVKDSETKVLLKRNGIDVDRINTFLEKAVPSIERGEMAKGLFFGNTKENPVGLMTIMREISTVISKRDDMINRVTKLVELDESNKIEFKDEQHFDDVIHEIINRCRKSGRNIPLDELKINHVDILASDLRNENVYDYMKNPDLLERLWNESSTPSKTFKDVDGVIIVSKNEGYKIIPKEDLDKFIQFERISQHKAKFKLLKKKK